MTWLSETADGATAMERVLGLRPELFDLYRALYAQLWQERLVDPVVLELCRIRVAHLHGSDAEQMIRYQPALDAGLTEEKVCELRQWPTSPLYSDHERACLAYAEQFVIDVHGISDGDAAKVAAGMTAPELVAFNLALGLFDGLGRFRVVLGIESTFDVVTTVAAPLAEAGTLH